MVSARDTGSKGRPLHGGHDDLVSCRRSRLGARLHLHCGPDGEPVDAVAIRLRIAAESWGYCNGRDDTVMASGEASMWAVGTMITGSAIITVCRRQDCPWRGPGSAYSVDLRRSINPLLRNSRL